MIGEDAVQVIGSVPDLRHAKLVAAHEERCLPSEACGLHLDEPVGSLGLERADVKSQSVPLRDRHALYLESQSFAAGLQKPPLLEGKNEFLAPETQ